MNAGPVAVGVDGSEESRLALRWAFEYGQMSGAQVEAVIAWRIPPSYGWPASYDDVDLEKQAQETLEDTIRDVLGDNAPVTRRVEQGHPAPALVAASEHAQLLVIGSRGHGAFAGMLLGSVSQHCVHHAHCPVVVFRRDESESPPRS
jgi:nucleotide-binding universal stress UspA family protein